MEHLDTIRHLESELADKRRATGQELRAIREGAGLSLREVAPKTKVTAATLSLIETGKIWNTKTVTRVAKVYAALEPAA